MHRGTTSPSATVSSPSPSGPPDLFVYNCRETVYNFEKIRLNPLHFGLNPLHSVLKCLRFVLKCREFVLNPLRFGLNPLHFVLKCLRFVLKCLRSGLKCRQSVLKRPALVSSFFRIVYKSGVTSDEGPPAVRHCEGGTTEPTNGSSLRNAVTMQSPTSDER